MSCRARHRPISCRARGTVALCAVHGLSGTTGHPGGANSLQPRIRPEDAVSGSRLAHSVGRALESKAIGGFHELKLDAKSKVSPARAPRLLEDVLSLGLGAGHCIDLLLIQANRFVALSLR
jgi:hypothetical protein